MKKEEFIKQINEIQSFIDDKRKVADTFNNILCRGSVASVVDFGDNIISLLIDHISQSIGTESEIIFSYVWKDSGTYWEIRGKPLNTLSPDDLWEALKAKRLYICIKCYTDAYLDYALIQEGAMLYEGEFDSHFINCYREATAEEQQLFQSQKETKK